jgi:hypothetical protein
LTIRRGHMEHISHVIRQGKLQGLAWVPLIVAICLNAGAAHPAELATHHLLTLEVARQIASSAELVAEKNGWPCVITVVDSSGYLITLSRMDASARTNDRRRATISEARWVQFFCWLFGREGQSKSNNCMTSLSAIRRLRSQ